MSNNSKIVLGIVIGILVILCLCACVTASIVGWFISNSSVNIGPNLIEIAAGAAIRFDPTLTEANGCVGAQLVCVTRMLPV